MADPVFSAEDRVNDPTLPPELVGKSPAEIAKFYQQREATLVKRANDALRAASDNPPRSSVTITQPTDRSPNQPAPSTPITRADAEALVSPARETLVQSARMVASNNKPFWAKYSTEIEQVMSNLPVEERMQSQTWETAYYSVVGLHAQEIEAAAKQSAAIAAEPPAAAPTPAPTPVDLTKLIHPESGKTAVDVCNGLNISQDSYRESMTRIDKGVWPLTRDNVGRK